ncbi:MAG: PD40 domain-containing protein [Flavobacteriaceae bacterium]|nr:PD40 domain-containing protein [Flavobacteriaceae bacterium]
MQHYFLVMLLLLSAAFLHAQSIHRTACQGNLVRLDSLLQNTAIDSEDRRGRSLLHWAVACDRTEVFDHLVQKGIAINSQDHEGATPLHMAIRFERMGFFEKLVALQPDASWLTTFGPSLMTKAVLTEQADFLKKMVALGVDVDGLNERGSTPLEIALRIEANEIATVLSELGAKPELVRRFSPQGAYLGQDPPGTSAKLFAPNVISTEASEFGSVFNKASDEFYYAIDMNGKNEIRFTKKRIDGTWSPPVVLLSHDRYGYNDPFLSPDEQRLYFISKRAFDGEGNLKDQDIWYIERTKKGWSSPINVGPNINTDRNEYYISFTQDGSLYFASNSNAPEDRVRSDYDLYKAEFVDGAFKKAEPLTGWVNTEAYEADVFVDPQERYLIFCGMLAEGYGRGDLYISFKTEQGQWTKALNMGLSINTQHHELCPFVTHDGNYLFYTSQQDIYWVGTEIIEELQKKALGKQ